MTNMRQSRPSLAEIDVLLGHDFVKARCLVGLKSDCFRFVADGLPRPSAFQKACFYLRGVSLVERIDIRPFIDL
jgi:hypothetical protein